MRREEQDSERDKATHPALIADGTLGRLARWLRLLGFDTVYAPGDDIDAIAYQARSEGRVLVTRHQALARRQGLRSIFITSSALREQLRQVVAVVGRPPGSGPRCMACNVCLDEVPHAVAEAHVPPYVARTQDRFHRCPKCGKIYWRGTHWQGVDEVLDQALPEL